MEYIFTNPNCILLDGILHTKQTLIYSIYCIVSDFYKVCLFFNFEIKNLTLEDFFKYCNLILAYPDTIIFLLLYFKTK